MSVYLKTYLKTGLEMLQSTNKGKMSLKEKTARKKESPSNAQEG